ncbi:MAG: response regulator [Proteobacteria bacterium]|nr:MAG: response regulator [Pseudomonadota bacterium]
MAENPIVNKSARVVVVEAVPARRMLLADVLRGMGYGSISTVNKPQELIGHLKASPTDWILMPLSSEHTVNGMHILKILTTYPSLNKIRVSMMFSDEEKIHIPLAFELGLLSCHVSQYNRESMTRDMQTLLFSLQQTNQDLTLVSANYLRNALVEQRASRLRLVLEQNLNEMYPADPTILFNLAKAQISCSLFEESKSTINHMELVSKKSNPLVLQLRKELEDADTHNQGAHGEGSGDEDEIAPIDPSTGYFFPQTKTNLLGLKNCVIIDADETTQYLAETLVKDAGIEDVLVFSDGKLAWDALKDKPEPDFILMEWVIPSLTGPLLLQRFRQKGFLHVPIVIISSDVGEDDLPLVSEMGVSAVIDKPIDQKSFFKSVVSVLQNSRRPHEQISLEQKIRQLLESGSIGEAERLWQPYRMDTRIPPSSQWQLEAEFMFYYERYEEACEFASNALQEFPSSLSLLNLLGKCLLKLGRYKMALKCFSRAQNISPMNIERLCRIAETQHFLKDSAGSAAAIKEAEHIDPNNQLIVETKANIALDNAEVKHASELMGKLESLRGVLAFMNNRAIALTRAGQFDDGITLYRNTIAALPGQWSEIHDSIAYNLGLAHARYGELKKAMDTLQRIKAPSPLLKKKANSLLDRLKHAATTGNALELIEASDTKSMDQNKVKARGEMLAKVELRKGDMCCYLVFQAGDAAASSRNLLNQLPVFAKMTDEEKSPETSTHVKPFKKRTN